MSSTQHYCTPRYAWLFICYSHLANYLPYDKPVVLTGTSVSLETVRQRLFQGRRYIFTTTREEFAPFINLANATTISIDGRQVLIKPVNPDVLVQSLTELMSNPFIKFLADVRAAMHAKNKPPTQHIQADISHMGQLPAVESYLTQLYARYYRTIRIHSGGVLIHF